MSTTAGPVTMGMVITVAIVTKSCGVIVPLRNSFIDPAIALAAPSAIIVSYCSEPMTERRIAGSAMPIEPMSVTTPMPMPMAGRMENVTDVVMTFLIFPISILRALARRSERTM